MLKASPLPDPSLVLYWPLNVADLSIQERGVQFLGRFTPREIIGGDTIGYLETNLLYDSFLAGVGNPAFDVAQIKFLDDFVNALIPDYVRTYVRNKFGIFELITDADPDSIFYLDATEISACGKVLLDSQTNIASLLKRAAYTLPTEGVIRVIFDYKPGSANPVGQIYVQGELAGEKAYRENVLTHELFHSFQFAFGYDTVWKPPVKPRRAWDWMFEGTARWSEVYFYQRVLLPGDLGGLFQSPEISLFNAGYAALPFWIAFEALGKSNSTRRDSIFLTLFTEFERQGDPTAALRTVASAELRANRWNVGSISGVDYFFALFSLRRLLGSWGATDEGSVLYPRITNVDGNEIEVRIRPHPLAWTATTGSASTRTLRTPASAAYLVIEFDDSMQGVRFNLELDPPPNTAASFSLVRRLGPNPVAVYTQVGKTVMAKDNSPPPATSFGLALHEAIDLRTSDNWVLIFNGVEQHNSLVYSLKLWNGTGGFPPPPPELVTDLRVRIETADAAFAGTSLQVAFETGGEVWVLANSFTRGTTREFTLDPRGLTIPELTSVRVSVSGGIWLDLINPWLATSLSWLLDGVTLIANGRPVFERHGLNVWLGNARESWSTRIQP